MDVRRIVEEGLAKEVNPAPADRYYAGFMPTGMFAASPADRGYRRLPSPDFGDATLMLDRTWCSRVTISSMWETSRDAIRDRAAGLYSRDTRHLNGIQILLNGRVPEMLAVNTHHASAATIVSANPALSLNGDDNLLLPHQVAIEQRLSLDTRLHVSYVLQNYSTLSLPLRFGLLSADFDDVFEVRGYKRKERGTLLRPHAHQGAVRLRYRACDDTIVETLISFDRIPQITLQGVVERDEYLVGLLPAKGEVSWEPAPDDMVGVLATFPLTLEPGVVGNFACPPGPESASIPAVYPCRFPGAIDCRPGIDNNRQSILQPVAVPEPRRPGGAGQPISGRAPGCRRDTLVRGAIRTRQPDRRIADSSRCAA